MHLLHMRNANLFDSQLAGFLAWENLELVLHY